MSITTVCRECGETFRKFSIKSRERICPDCRGSKGRNRYKVMTNNTLNAIGTIETLDKKVAELTTSIDVLHSTVEVEVQHQITKNEKSKFYGDEGWNKRRLSFSGRT